MGRGLFAGCQFITENHQPPGLGVVSLPSARLPRRLDFDSFITTKLIVASWVIGGDKVRMPSDVTIAHNGASLLRDILDHHLRKEAR